MTTRKVPSTDGSLDFIWTNTGIKPWSPLPIPRSGPLIPSLIGEIIALPVGKLYIQFPVDTLGYIIGIVNKNRPSRNTLEGEIKYDSGVPSVFCIH